MHRFKKEEYPLMHLFKHKIAIERDIFSSKIYTFHKSSISIYKWLFVGIGTFYVGLAAFLFHKTFSWNYELIFGNNFGTKTLLISLCLLISFFSLSIGLFMKAETEAAKSLLRKGKRRIKRLHEKKLILNGLTSLIQTSIEKQQTQAFKQEYHETLAYFSDIQEETLQLMHRISTAPEISLSAREELFNQALLELKQRIESIACSFESSSPRVFLKSF